MGFKMKQLIIMIILIAIPSTLIAKDFNLNVRITSFWRSPEQQAYLIYDMKKRGVNLKTLYVNKGIIDNIIKAKTVKEIEAEIREGISKGVYLSKHLCGKALDVSKTGDYRDFVNFLSKIKGVKALDEGDHFHFQLTTKCN